MALIPGTLPNDTCYGTPQDLLELFAQYLDVPAFALSSKVVFSTTNTGFTSDIVWFDTTSATRPIMKITVSSSGFLDYVKNYITAAPVVTIVGADSVLILDASDSSNTKRGLVSDIVALASKVVQIVEGSSTTATTNSASAWADTSLSVSITPTSSSNKVLILIAQSVYMYNNSFVDVGAGMRLLRGATILYAGESTNGDLEFSLNAGSAGEMKGIWAFQYLDSPSSSSSLTYKTQFYRVHGSDYITCQKNSIRSSILAVEVTP